MAMLRRLYDWTLHWAGHRHAIWALAVVAFAESSVFPIPPDVLLIPMILAARERALRYATVCTIMSVLGGFAGYAIGWGLYETVGTRIIAFYGLEATFASFVETYNALGAWIVAFFGVSFFPYKVITIASGVAGMDLLNFGIASVVSRGIRFFIVALLLWRFGTPIRAFIEKRLALLVTIGVALLLAGFLTIRYL